MSVAAAVRLGRSELVKTIEKGATDWLPLDKLDQFHSRADTRDLAANNYALVELFPSYLVTSLHPKSLFYCSTGS